MARTPPPNMASGGPDWAMVTNTPTTLVGYGITDATPTGSIFATKNGAPVSGTDGGFFIVDTSQNPKVLYYNLTSAGGDSSAVNSSWISLLTGITS